MYMYTYVHIDVDDNLNMPGSGTQKATLRLVISELYQSKKEVETLVRQPERDRESTRKDL